MSGAVKERAPRQTDVVRLDFGEAWPAVLAALQLAVNFRRIPPGWRLSEYVMTKMDAMDSLRLLASRGPELSLFSWGVLSGELARHAHYARSEEALRAWMELHKALEACPPARRLFREARQYEQAQRQAERARRRLADLEERWKGQDITRRFEDELATGPVIQRAGLAWRTHPRSFEFFHRAELASGVRLEIWMEEGGRWFCCIDGKETSRLPATVETRFEAMEAAVRLLM